MFPTFRVEGLGFAVCRAPVAAVMPEQEANKMSLNPEP